MIWGILYIVGKQDTAKGVQKWGSTPEKKIVPQGIASGIESV